MELKNNVVTYWTGGQQESLYQPSTGSPLPLKCPANSYFLTFVQGNISRCAGGGTQNFKSPDGKLHTPPENLCLQHRDFGNPRTGFRQQSHD